MEFSTYSLIGALVMLVFGLVDLLVIGKVVYPRLRWRYEQAKANQTQGMDPGLMMRLLWMINLVVLPLVGFLFLGGAMKSIFG